MPDRPLSRYAKVLGVTLLAGLIAGFVSGVVTVFMPPSGWVGGAFVAVTVALAMAAALWASIGWWRGLDEAAQEAHKWAWWWGATVGLCVAGVVLLTLIYGFGDFGLMPLKDGIMLGAAIVAGCQVGGYGIAWAVWWSKRR